jgi:L-lactate dehydrogenase complex protein LldF
MESKTKQFKKAAAATIANPELQSRLRNLYDGFYKARDRAVDATPNWDELSDKGRAIKAHTIQHLGHYLEMAEAIVIKSGGKVYFAKDAEAANKYVLDLARSRGVRSAIKSKSMISEEMGLNQRLEQAGIEAVETDLGEYLIQLKGETPYHIIAPAIHMSKADAASVLQAQSDVPIGDSIEEMAGAARVQLREKFVVADMGITGVNFLVAETGTVVLVTNEGNGRMSTSMPPIHVAIMGMEKVVPSMEDLGTMLRLLVRSATGQRLSSYVTTVTGPRRESDVDGPDEFHLVIVDNGRSKMLADPEMREALYCLRCGACLNACPVYRKVGGHSYGWVYSGPIGAVVSPMLTSLPEARDLPHASSLCGACREICPVRIDIPRMLLHMRSELAEGRVDPKAKSVPLMERLSMKAWRMSVASPMMLRISNRLGRILQMPLARAGRINKLPPPLSGWTRHRTFPVLAKRPFRDRWKDIDRGGR